MGAILEPQQVCGCPSNPSLSPIRPIHSFSLTACELVRVPGRSMGAVAGAADGVAACGHAWLMYQAPEAAAATCLLASRRPRSRFWRLARWPGPIRYRVQYGSLVAPGYRRPCACLGGGIQWPQPGQVVFRGGPRTHMRA